MIKIFSFCGSAQKISITNNVTKEFLKRLSTKLNEPTQIIHRKIKEGDIRLVTTYSQFNSDNVTALQKLKKEILESDIVVFSSPVYFRNVSAGMKLLIDQLTSWTHTFELIGKYGICIVVGNTNGSEYVEEYMNDFMMRLGLGSIQTIVYNSNITTIEELENKLEEVSHYLSQRINSDIAPKPTKNQEMIYESYKNVFLNLNINEFEKKKWLSRDNVENSLEFQIAKSYRCKKL